MAGAPIAIFGPTIAATVALRREGGWPAVRGLFVGLVRLPPQPAWLLVALVLPAVTCLAGRAVYALVPGSEDVPWFFLPGDAQRVIGAILVPLGEEIGWRGYALPRLLARHGPLRASLILGVLWALWHTCMLISVGSPPLIVVLGMIEIVIGSAMFTWMHQRTGGSLLAAVLLHMGAHLHNMSQSNDVAPLAISTASYAVLAVLLVVLDRRAFASDARGPIAA
jgi:membrane protease YdiL (CAAX protease family)